MIVAWILIAIIALLLAFAVINQQKQQAFLRPIQLAWRNLTGADSYVVTVNDQYVQSPAQVPEQRRVQAHNPAVELKLPRGTHRVQVFPTIQGKPSRCIRKFKVNV